MHRNRFYVSGRDRVSDSLWYSSANEKGNGNSVGHNCGGVSPLGGLLCDCSFQEYLVPDIIAAGFSIQRFAFPVPSSRFRHAPPLLRRAGCQTVAAVRPAGSASPPYPRRLPPPLVSIRVHQWFQPPSVTTAARAGSPFAHGAPLGCEEAAIGRWFSGGRRFVDAGFSARRRRSGALQRTALTNPFLPFRRKTRSAGGAAWIRIYGSLSGRTFGGRERAR
jgi:hypothetical protein